MNIKELRSEFNLSQEGLSRQTGIPKGRINQWEQRNTTPKVDDYNTLVLFFENLRKQKLSIIDNSYHTSNIPLDKKELPFNNIQDNVNRVEEERFEYNLGNTFRDLGNGRIEMLVPLVEQYAYAGYLSGFTNADYIEELPKVAISVEKHHKGNYRAFKVRGDSMDNGMKHSISSGDTVIGRMINKEHWKNRLHLFQWQNYIIVHEDGIIVKRITQHDVENGIIHCESLNTDKQLYPDFQINLTEVYELYNVVQIIINNY